MEKKISAAYPCSGCISDIYNKWYLGVPAHEFGQHYAWQSHLDGFGSHNISGGGIASAHDRRHFGWTTFGNVYEPTSNTTQDIVLRDYITTGDYIRISAPGKTWFIENRRRLNYYSTDSYHGWRWTVSEPLFPIQADSGLMIYKMGGLGGTLQHAFGKWDWKTCNSDSFYQITKTPYNNQFLPQSVNRYTGKQIVNLSFLPVKSTECNTIINQYNNQPLSFANFWGANGDSNTFFDIGYNTVYSPWSNPGFEANIYDSLTIELTGRNSDGSLNVKIIFTNMLLASPSKPQFLKASKQYTGNPPGAFYVRLNWLRNKEPDMSTYGIYKATTNTPGEDGAYTWLTSTSDTAYLDQSILMYDPNSRNYSSCPSLYATFSYKITAVDITDKESAMSERDSISGYFDPCTMEPSDNSLFSDEEGQLRNNLSQNYPNPFNPVTLINYSLKNDGHVMITLYDISGRSITVLVNENKTAGSYFVKFNASSYNLSSGIYFYKIEAQGFAQIRKMLLIK